MDNDGLERFLRDVEGQLKSLRRLREWLAANRHRKNTVVIHDVQHGWTVRDRDGRIVYADTAGKES